MDHALWLRSESELIGEIKDLKQALKTLELKLSQIMKTRALHAQPTTLKGVELRPTIHYSMVFYVI